jgi:hypothetical protein
MDLRFHTAGLISSCLWMNQPLRVMRGGSPVAGGSAAPRPLAAAVAR